MSDDDPNPRASSGLTGANRDLRSMMRSMLREQGIELDPVPAARTTAQPEPSSYLVELGTRAMRERAEPRDPEPEAEPAPAPEVQRGWPKVQR